MEKETGILLKKLLIGLLFCLLTVVFLPFTSAEASAKTPKCVSKMTAYYYNVGDGDMSNLEAYSAYIYIKNLSSGAKITNMKSSKKRIVVSAMNNTDSKMNAVAMTVKNGQSLKDGMKTTISFNVKQGGTTYKLSCKVTFKEAKTPFKKFTIGSKDLTNKFNGVYNTFTKKIKGQKTITVKPTSDFKIDSIELTYTDGTWKTVKSGTKIKTKNLSTISIYYSVKEKPKYYKKPAVFYAKVSSPLQEFVQVVFTG